MFGESWRVEHDEVVEAARGRRQESEGVFGYGFMARRVGEVQGHVGVGQRHCFCAGVDRSHPPGASAQGIDAEAAGVAEHIQNAPPPGIVLEQSAVLALVDEEPCFLSLEPVDMEFQPVFESYVRGVAPDEIAVAGAEVSLEGEGCL